MMSIEHASDYGSQRATGADYFEAIRFHCITTHRIDLLAPLITLLPSRQYA